MLACGGGGSDPAAPAPNQGTRLVIPDGTFSLTATMSVDGCARSDVWDGNYDVHIDGKTFTMGQFTGTWDVTTRLARGENTKSSHLVRSCTVSEWTTAYLTFTTKDAFHGSFVFRHSIKGDCTNLNPCSTTWTVKGTRVPAP